MAWIRKKEPVKVEQPPVSKVEQVPIGKVDTVVEQPNEFAVMVDMVSKMTDAEFKANLLMLLIEIREGINGSNT